jgi:hypothetical protein
MRQFAAPAIWRAAAMSCTFSAFMRGSVASIIFSVAVAMAWSPVRGAESLASGIQDNSFLVEEAYNQERGIVQHIFNALGTVTPLNGNRPDDREWDYSFTQEWPVGSQTHQFSYTFASVSSNYVHGFGDITLNYRYQALYEDDHTPAFSPRLSVLLATGDKNDGIGYGKTGYQFNLPVSKIIGNRWTVHGNAGGTTYPGVSGSDPCSVNLGASAIYAVSEDFNLMLEAVSTWAREPNETGGTDHGTTALLSPGVRKAINFSNAQMVVGLALPVGLTSDSPDYGVFLYFSFEHPFLKGVTMP